MNGQAPAGGAEHESAPGRKHERFSELWRGVGKSLVGRARCMCRDADSAEDLVNSTAEGAWRSFQDFDEAKGTFHRWCGKIMKNEFLADIRRPPFRRRYGPSAAAPLDGNLPDPRSASPDSDVQRREAREQLEAAMLILSPTERRIVHLTFFEERTNTEVAVMLSTTAATVAVRKSVALRKLREFMRDGPHELTRAAHPGG